MLPRDFAGLGISQSIGIFKSVVKSELTRLRFDCCSIVQVNCFSMVAESVGYLEFAGTGGGLKSGCYGGCALGCNNLQKKKS